MNSTELDAYFAAQDAKYEMMEHQDKVSKGLGILPGRFISEPRGDGYAYYLIVKENKKTVRIERVTGLGDDWSIPMWGDAASIPKGYAEESLRRRDGLNALFGRE